jgi:ABC-2 type transport system ATP-binding protein
MSNIIQTSNLTKYYGNFCAVDKININVKQGEIYGFLGLNGAGKTTTIRMLLGMIKPTSGEAFLCDKKVESKNLELWRKVGYLVEVPYAYPELTVKENLEIVRRLRRLSDPHAVDDVMNMLKIEIYKDRKAGKLSLGNAQRLGLAKALIHKPEILLLDEPSNGLDPAGIVEMRELFIDLARNHGVTIFISSHILGEVSKLADRIGIIHNGALLQEMDADEINRLRRKRLLLTTSDNSQAILILKEAGYSIEMSEEGHLAVLDQSAIERPDAISEILAKKACYLSMLKEQDEDLESYFFSVIAKNGGAML